MDSNAHKQSPAQARHLLAIEQQAHRVAEVLSAATQAFSRTLDFDVILALLLDYLEQLVPYDRAAILLREADGRLCAHLLRGDAHLSEAERLRARSISPGSLSHLDVLMASRAGLLIGDTAADPLWTPGEESEQPRCWLGTTLIVDGALIGVCTIEKMQPRFFTDEHRRTVAALVAQAAVALHNAGLFEQAREGRARLQALSRQLVEMQEAERRRIARELHDQIGQSLTGLKLLLEMVSILPPDRIAAQVREARATVTELMAYVRELSLDLRPAMLDDLGLLPALLWHFDRYTVQTSVRVLFLHFGVRRRFGAEIEIAAYRIIQEALTNVARHAHVGEVSVQIQADDTMLSILVQDQGRGCDPQAALNQHASSGLAGMRERAVLLGGYMTITAAPEAGFALAVVLPLRAETEPHTEEW